MGVVGFRGDNLLRGNSVIFDYTKKRFICYEIRKTKDRVLVDSRDYTEQIKDAERALKEAGLNSLRKHCALEEEYL